MFNYGRENGMRGYNRILNVLVAKSMSEVEIMQTLNCLPTNLKQNLVDAQSLGYIVKNEDVYTLTEAGQNCIENNNGNPINVRIHRNAVYSRGRMGRTGRGGRGQFRGF